MGQCGCGDFNAEYRIQGPGSLWYSIQVYPSCSYCDSPVGVIITAHDEQDCKDWGIAGLPVLDADNNGLGGFIPILAKETLYKHIKNEGMDTEELDYADSDRIVKAAVCETIYEHMKSVK